MLVGGSDIEVDVIKCKEGVTEAREFFVCMNHGDLEAAGAVEVAYLFKTG